ncbi:MAG: biotin/lipoyl-containing protein [Syntrophothermus sp.]|nr:biotin/lipoyl-containing protein [Ignavibacteriaceae bacterium]
MKKYKIKIKEKEFDVDIIKLDDNIADVVVNGTKYTVELNKKITTSKTPVLVRSKVEPSTDSDKSLSRTNVPSSPKGAGYIKSPLPGIILEIKAKVGDRVKIGDPLLVLEAMKMENNIKADKEGTITAIKVNVRDAVLEGDILIEIGG